MCYSFKMEELEVAVKILKRLCRQTSPVTMKMVSDCFATLQYQAEENGLSEEVLNLCSDFIEAKCHSYSIMHSLLRCLIPESIVPDRVVRSVLKWLFCLPKSAPNPTVLRALQWVAGVLEFGLGDEKPIYDYYYMFYSLLEWPMTEKVACWLVVRLTRPDDVDRNMVMRLMFTDLKTKSTTRNIILWCYKTFKPECVPQPVAARSIQSTLKLSAFYTQYFGLARQRIAADNTERFTHLKQQMDTAGKWKLPERQKRPCMELMPNVEYIHFGSSLYRQDKSSILQITTWKQYSAFALQIGIPCNILSLLQNPFGQHVLSCGDVTLQTRFAYTLYNLLQYVIIDRLVQVPLKKQEDLLDNICEYQEYTQEGIPVMSRFFAGYVAFWDGFTFLPQLMRLLPWVTFSSFSELKNFYLVHLYYVYISSNVMVKCNILRALTNLAHNLALQVNIEGKVYFHSLKLNDAEDILCDLIKYMENLCVLGLRSEPDSVILLHEVLRLYEFLLDTEEKAGLHVRSILPPAVVYFSLFSRNYANIERVCSLLLKYDASIRVQKSLRIEVTDKAKLVDNYSNDFMNFLWLDEAFSGRKRGFIFREMNTNAIQKIANEVDIDKAFNIVNNIPLTCFYDRNLDDYEARKGFIRELKKFAPDIYNFLKQNVKKKR